MILSSRSATPEVPEGGSPCVDGREGNEVPRRTRDAILDEDFEWRREVTGTIEYPAVHEETVLYAAS